ncbi:MAG: diguanylate cyclase [Dehalococcoidia bacterium]|nr:diguanylate cyclase [Dehalococcoidia bacterium]
MALGRIVATAGGGDNAQASSSVTTSPLGDIRALWRAHRVVSALMLTVPFLTWATTGQVLPALFVPGVLFMILTQAEAVLVPRLSEGSRVWVVVAFRVVYMALVVVGVPAMAPWPWLTPSLLGLMVLNSALILPGRALAVLTTGASLANVLAAALPRWGGIRLAEGLTERMAEPLEVLVFSAVVFPACALFLHVRGRRTREIRGRLERTIGDLRAVRDDLEASQEQLRRWNRQLNAEVDLQTNALEERNRYLSIINAVSFALAEPMDDSRALERAVRLVARLLGVRAAQAYTRERAGEVVDLFVTVAPEDLHAPRLPEALLRSVARTGRPLTSTHPDWEPDVELPDLGEPYHVVPLVAKGRVLGSFALIGDGTLTSDDDGRHLLLLVGREMGVALENARLYQEAVEKAAREEFLAEVTRLLNGGARGERALPGVLEALIGQTGAREALLVSLPEGSRDFVIAGTAAVDDAPSWLEPVARSLTSLVNDRSAPLVLGAGGESPLSGALVTRGVTSVVVAPIFATRSGVMPTLRRGGADDGSGDLRPGVSLAGALLVASGSPEPWGEDQTSLLHRVAEVIARRVQADELVAVQQQRIRELTGLAEVARTMQSGADVERLYNGFATALHHLLPYEHLYIARLDEAGLLTGVPAFGLRGRPDTPGPSLPADGAHPWFASREPILWRRGEGHAPAFVPEDARNAVVVPMRPKGQMLGVAVVVVPRPLRSDQVHIVEQAVEQLSLALDGASLYQQATARASHIQALSNLARIVASVVNLREAFAAFSEEVRWLIPFDRAVMFLLDESGEAVEPYATYPEDVQPEGPTPTAGSVASVPIALGSAVTVRRDDPRHAGLDWSLLGDDAREVAAVPVRQGERTSAVFALVNNNVGEYDMSELDALEEVAGLLAVTIERLRLYEHADHSAKHDLLTGLPNYRYLQERLHDLRLGITDVGRSAAMVIDMDNLKTFNDLLGHESGDRVIEIVARELRAACRQQDFVARTGGDEFVIVMEGAGTEAASAVADRIHEALHEAHLEIPDAPVRIGVSIGVAEAPADAETTGELLQAADQAMYDAKVGGGQRTRTARAHHGGSDSLRSLRGREVRLAETLFHALTSGATVEEMSAISTAARWLGAVILRAGTPPEVLPQLRLLVASRASRRLAAPSTNQDQSLAHYLVGRIYRDWKSINLEASETVTLLIPAMLDIAWMMLPRPAGEGLTVERALARYLDMYPHAAMHKDWPTIDEIVRSNIDRRAQDAA